MAPTPENPEPDRLEPDTGGRFAYHGLERVIHEKARLGILTSLATSSPGLFFTDLRELCELTDGNLSRHLAALKEAGLVEVLRGSSGGRPQSLVKITAAGRVRFTEYIAELERVVSDAVKSSRDEEATGEPWPDGWSPA
jgi:DNA-binding MarR family transcriptional regulator